ncbi:Zinc finger protein-related [Tripterygium wilfordii]|uniref:Zinc finger protein-related n=1 Tax=Tripterygium wilfordii TaxID=458696 RepID=A0A7J7CCL2_TRIWF|nr:ankyrin repeat and zinc finger domain-containing protein 1 [Tripterygium wilfordii]KAF5731675.1 Zinc finger protein-related [Tripterygium wilfordii]
MATEPSPPTMNTTASPQEKRHRSIFEVPSTFFDGCRLISPAATTVPEPLSISGTSILAYDLDDAVDKPEKAPRHDVVPSRWTCNTCKGEFDSLQDQRSHFKSDIHRFNVKLSLAGKDIVKEEDFDELTSDSFKDYDVSSISGSEDEAEKGSLTRIDLRKGSTEIRQKLFIHLQTRERVSIWKCLLLNESESISYENDTGISADNSRITPHLTKSEVLARLRFLTHEPRDNSQLRIVLLASGGHFAGCVFDGSLVVTHKTFHRYVVRAKSGRTQSSKDATGKAANSAGAALRRYNELALKKDIQELLALWKPYFEACSCIFIHAPSTNRQLLYNGEKPYFSHQHCVICNVPLTVRRPTFKEAKRIYNQLTQVAYEVDDKDIGIKEEPPLTTSTISNGNLESMKVDSRKKIIHGETVEAFSSLKYPDEPSRSSESDSESVCTSTPLHEAAQSGNVPKVLELLEQGLDPCIKNENGQTPYMVASEKEVRNTFRRFMALNLDKWDWHAANVPSALTKEMEESQAAKQAEKDAKRKARAKELKKLRKAKEKKAQEQAAASQNAKPDVKNQPASPSVSRGPSQSSGGSRMSMEEERKQAQAVEREKRAAAAEKRLAATLNAQHNSTTSDPSPSQPKSGAATDLNCSCCGASLAGKVPFHRYNYKYCSTSCMYVHKEHLEDE